MKTITKGLINLAALCALVIPTLAHANWDHFYHSRFRSTTQVNNHFENYIDDHYGNGNGYISHQEMHDYWHRAEGHHLKNSPPSLRPFQGK